MQSPVSYNPDDVPHLRSQNDQLWKIIEKQRVMIQNLQKDNVRLSAERDGLQDKVNQLEHELTRKKRVTSLIISPQAMKEMAESDDAPHTSSPVETATNTPTQQQQQQQQFANNSSGPMPPPRSPYRSLREKPEEKAFSDEMEEFNLAMTSMNGRSSPGSPNPSPIYSNIKFNATTPNITSTSSTTTGNHRHPSLRKGSHDGVLSPSKSTSSSLKGHHHQQQQQQQQQQQDSMMLPPTRPTNELDPILRAISPTPLTRPPIYTNTGTSSSSRTDLYQQHITTTTTTTNNNNNNNNNFNNGNSIQHNNEDNNDETDDDDNEREEREQQHHHHRQRRDIEENEEERAEQAKKDRFLGNFHNIVIRVVASNIKANEKGKEVVSFTLAIGSNKNDKFEERWRVEKLYSDFLSLDSKLKAQRNRAISSRIGKLPDKALFSNNAPSKVDQRKVALEQYLQHVITLPLEDNSDLFEFLSSNVIDTKTFQNSGLKEGYLTKRGKNFGGWKTRYFVLNESVLEYYESKEGTQLGSIRLTNAQIGRQMPGTSPASEEYNSVYRHAFLIVEQKRSGSSHYVRHILCASSDDDRDEWVQALLLNIQIDEDELPKNHFGKKLRETSINKGRKLSKGEIRPIAATPISHLKLDNVVSHADMEKLTNVPVVVHFDQQQQYSKPSPSISSESSDSLSHHNWHDHQQQQQQHHQMRSSFDQPNRINNNLQAPRPTVVRRSSMGNLIGGGNHSEEEYRSTSPNPEENSPLEEPENKKARNKANRMTFWGRKMLFSNNSSNTSDNNNSNQQQQTQASPRPSQSSSTTTSSSSSNHQTTATTTTTISSGGLRGLLSRTSHEQNDQQRSNNRRYDEMPTKSTKQVFGVPLDEAVRTSRVKEGYELPAVVYRCIEYLDAMNAVLEEGIYRLSGSNSTMKALRERFNQEGDVNLLTSKEEYDIHVVAGLLKMWLRELPTSVLTREYRMDFLHVIDLLDRKDRVNELGRLVSVLPLTNYTLLRALTAHLIRVVQHSDINKMTMRNVSIVFSPTLGIPATIFNLFLSEFEYIFWTTEDGNAAPRRLGDEEEEEEEEEVVVTTTTTEEETRVQEQQQKRNSRLKEEQDGRNNRNSVNYMDGAPHAIVDLEKNLDGPLVLDEDEDDVDDLSLDNADNDDSS